MLEAGTVRKENTVNILLKNLVDSCVAALVWWGVGYPLAFGQGTKALRSFIGGSNFFMLGNTDLDEYPEFYAHWFFQWAFAATAVSTPDLPCIICRTFQATIVSGALAERCQFRAYVLYTIVVTSIVYPIIVHWVWSEDGWLSTGKTPHTFNRSIGLIDYAGSSVVHVTGGGAALFGAWRVGPRLNRFTNNGKNFKNEPNNIGFSLLGTFILWFGWYGFNSASGTCVKDCMITASLIAVNTTISAATGGTTVLTLHYLTGGIVHLAPGLNGILAGLVAITAGCAVVEPYAAFIIGTVGSAGYYGASCILQHAKIDDPLDASPVHFIGGIVGTIAVGLFAKDDHIARAYPSFNKSIDDVGLFLGGDGTQLGVQILGTLVIAAWTCAISFVLFSVLSYYGCLRVPEALEIPGLDASTHGTRTFRLEMTSGVGPSGQSAE
eukprot:g208.t1